MGVPIVGLHQLARCERPLWGKRCEIDTFGLAVNNELGHRQAACWGIQNTPATMASGKVDAGDPGKWAEERQTVC